MPGAVEWMCCGYSGRKKPLRIVLLTAAIDDASLLEAKMLKVQGIVLKNSDPAFLLDCLDRVRHGRAWIDPELDERVKHLAKTVDAGSRVSLAPRERQLIGFVRTGLRNREIAEQLGVTEGTVKVYLHAIFEKLGVTAHDLASGPTNFWRKVCEELTPLDASFKSRPSRGAGVSIRCRSTGAVAAGSEISMSVPDSWAASRID